MFSTLTKILMGATVASGVAAGISIYHDNKIGESPIASIGEGEIPDVVSEDSAASAADEILNSAD